MERVRNRNKEGFSMIRDGRPYTNENGWEDNGLITDCSDDVKNAVDEWIRQNVRAAGKILPGRTSYGMKHLLEHDTGIYLTNNEFKDAMMLAGHPPVNAGEMNWRYRIVLTREINDNPSPFFQWAGKFKRYASPCGDFVRDMLACFDFPKTASHQAISSYLWQAGACRGAVDAFEELWRAYAGENH